MLREDFIHLLQMTASRVIIKGDNGVYIYDTVSLIPATNVALFSFLKLIV